MTRSNFLLVLLISLGLSACGDQDNGTPSPNQVPELPDRNEVLSYCSVDQPGVRIYLTDVYYGQAIAVIADAACP